MHTHALLLTAFHRRRRRFNIFVPLLFHPFFPLPEVPLHSSLAPKHEEDATASCAIVLQAKSQSIYGVQHASGWHAEAFQPDEDNKLCKQSSKSAQLQSCYAKLYVLWQPDPVQNYLSETVSTTCSCSSSGSGAPPTTCSSSIPTEQCCSSSSPLSRL